MGRVESVSFLSIAQAETAVTRPKSTKSQRPCKNAGQKRPADGSGRRAQFQEHGDAKIGHPLANVGRRRAARSGDDRDDRSADGVADIDAVQQRQRRHDDDSAAQADQRAEESGHDGDRQQR